LLQSGPRIITIVVFVQRGARDAGMGVC